VFIKALLWGDDLLSVHSLDSAPKKLNYLHHALLLFSIFLGAAGALAAVYNNPGPCAFFWSLAVCAAVVWRILGQTNPAQQITIGTSARSDLIVGAARSKYYLMLYRSPPHWDAGQDL
jgi:hypothetical protein